MLFSFRMMSPATALLIVLGSFAAAADTPPPGQPAADTTDNKPVAAVPTVPGRDWPLFRGDPRSTGVAQTTLPDQPVLLWQHEVPKSSFEATPAIVAGTVFIGDLDGTVHALNLLDGKLKWTYKSNAGFMASPAVAGGRVYLGDIDGQLLLPGCRHRQTGLGFCQRSRD